MLLSLLTVKMPITDADQIRALACKALVGLSRSSTVRQIISKLPLFSSGHIQQLMKEPVLQDKRSEHVKFCKFAAELIERISGKPLLIGTDVSLAWLQRASVVAQSKITFPEKELLLLIRNHLVAKGLQDTATALTKEAELPMACLSHSSHSPSTFPSVAPPLPALPSTALPRTPRLANGVSSRLGSHPSHASSPGSGNPPPRPSTSQPSTSSSSSSMAFASPAAAVVASCGHIGRIVFSRDRQAGCGGPSCKKPRVLRQKSDHGAFSQSPAMKKQFDRHLPSPPALDSIITEYLREQHSRCKNPVATCPPFSLFTPHQCPEPKQRRQAPINFTSRNTRRVIYPKYGGVDGGCFDRHLIFSRFVGVAWVRDERGYSLPRVTFTFLSPSALQVPAHLRVPGGGRGRERLHVLRLLRPRALPDAGDVHGAAQALQRVHGPGGGQLQLPHVGHHSPGALTGQWEESRTSPNPDRPLSMLHMQQMQD